jgi:hypothetical protein
MAVPGWIVIKARVWFFAVARGTSMPCNAGRRAATGATPTIGTTTSGSGLSVFQVSLVSRAGKAGGMRSAVSIDTALRRRRDEGGVG